MTEKCRLFRCKRELHWSEAAVSVSQSAWRTLEMFISYNCISTSHKYAWIIVSSDNHSWSLICFQHFWTNIYSLKKMLSSQFCFGKDRMETLASAGTDLWNNQCYKWKNNLDLIESLYEAGELSVGEILPLLPSSLLCLPPTVRGGRGLTPPFYHSTNHHL